MKVSDAIEFVKQLYIQGSPFTDYSAAVSEAYNVRRSWDTQIPFGDDNGIYFYVSEAGEVLYIGKGDRSDGNGIGVRACAHLGARQKQSDVMFPQHQWAHDEHVDDALKSDIAAGRFCIVTIKVEPSHHARFVESMLLLISKIVDGGYPALNKVL